MIFTSDRKSRILANGRRAALLALLAPALFFAACKSNSQASGRPGAGPSTEAREPRDVRLVAVQEINMPRVVTVTGTLAAYDQATISAKVPGRIAQMTVDLGSVVRRGQVIAQLDTTDYDLRVSQAEAALAQARVLVGLSPQGTETDVNIEQTGAVRQARARLDDARLRRDRAQRLLTEGVISRAELDTAEAELKVAESQYQNAVEEIRNRLALVTQRKSELDLARQQRADTAVKAPFDGVVQERIATLGEYIAGGAPVVTIVRMDPLRLRVEIPEREARSVRLGQEVRVTVEGDTNVYIGRVARLSPTITAENRVLVVEAEVRNTGQLRPGSFARAEVIVDQGAQAVAVPANTIVTFAGIEKVIIVQDDKAVEKPISSGRRSGEWVEIVEGLKVGDRVVVDPGNLQSGNPVRVVE